MNEQDNHLLTRVENGAPMGRMLQQYWHPVLRASRLEADGAPVRVRLLGQQFVAFRATDGRVGVIDEGCPHRQASMSLARNEEQGLRCIFHGWKLDLSGHVIDVPTITRDKRAEFAASVITRTYAVREIGGIVWLCLQPEELAPPFPDFEFTRLPEQLVDFRIAIMHNNWVQGMESVLDSAHLGFLHRGQLQREFRDSNSRAGTNTNISHASESTAPALEVDERPYGFREAALRELPDGRVYTKIREFVAPYFSFLPGNPETLNRRIVVASVPIDDTHCAQWFIFYNIDRPPTADELADRWAFATPDPDNFYADPGDASNAWHQDRVAMKNGHFSGFPQRHIFHEDFLVQESMGPIVDRTRENLNPSDRVIVHTRRTLINAARAFASGAPAWGLAQAGTINYRRIRSGALYLQAEQDWRTHDFIAPAALPGVAPADSETTDSSLLQELS